MFTAFKNKPFFYNNKNMKEYILKSTNTYLEKIIKNKNDNNKNDKNKIETNIVLKELKGFNHNDEDQFLINSYKPILFLGSLSIPTFILFFLYSNRKN
jgi:hypothetical protein